MQSSSSENVCEFYRVKLRKSSFYRKDTVELLDRADLLQPYAHFLYCDQSLLPLRLDLYYRKAILFKLTLSIP